MRKRRFWLIVRADQARPRVTSRRPYNLRFDEIAFALDISYPYAWGGVAEKAVAVTLPEPPVAEVEPAP